MKKFLLFFWNGFFLLKQKIADIFYLIKDFFYTRAHKAPNIMTCEDTLDYILKNNCPTALVISKEERSKQKNTNAKFVKANVDECPNLAGKYRVASIPTIMVFKNGEPVDTLVGFMPKERIVQKVKSHL